MANDPDIASDGGLRLFITPPVGGANVRDVRSAPGEDLAPRYAQLRTDRDLDQWLARARARSGAAAAPATNDPATPPAPGTPPAPPAFPPTTGAPLAPGAGSLPQPGADEALAAGGAVLRDVGRGATQTPRALAGGATDAVREMLEASGSLGDWLQSVAPGKVPAPAPMQAPFLADEALRAVFGQDVRLPGIETHRRFLENPFDVMAELVPKIGKPDSVTGALAHDVSQFVTGYLTGGKAMKAMGVAVKGAPAALAKGAFSDALAFDPNEENLAALLKKHAGLNDPVTTFLATDPKDGEALNRLRRALEGLGLGVATDGLAATLRAYRARRWARTQDDGGTVDQATAELRRQQTQHGSLEANAFAGLGDVADTGPLVRVEPQPLAAARVDRKAGDAVAATETGVPDDVVARGVAGGVEPPVAEGYTRLYRAEVPPERRVAAPDWIAQGQRENGHADAMDRWFVADKRLLDFYRADQGGAGASRTVYVDVPTSDLGKYRVSAVTDELAGRLPRSFSKDPENEFFVSRGVADQRRPLVGVSAQPPVPPGIAQIAGPGPKLIVNFARINSPDDVKALMRDAAEAFKDDIDVARRGVQSHEDTKALADALGMTVDDLLARRQGQPLNAAEALAARRLWVASTERLLELARVASSPQASPVDLFNFRRMMATHYAIQAEVIAARTETARALNAWKIPATSAGGIERSRAVTDALVNSGGDATAREMARRLSILADSGVDAAQLSAFTARGWAGASLDAVREVFMNGLLSSPTTHLVNVSSNALTGALQIVERRIAESISGLRAPDGVHGGAVAPGEALAMAHGVIAANRDAWRMAWLALASGESGQALATAAGRTLDTPFPRAISAQAFGVGNDAIGRTVDALGEIVRVPSRLLGAEDEFFKSIGYRMELHAQALRQARSENLAGDELAARVSTLLANPPEHIRLAATDAALYQTYTQHAGAVGEALMSVREAIPGAFVVLPFVRTPVNIFRFSLERTPLAPLVDSWRADIAAGGARADIAMARMAMGTSIMLAALDYADRGLVSGSGPSEPQRREVLERQGWKKYSVKVDGKWVAYDRTDPMGMLMGFAADFAEMMRKSDVEPDKMDDASEILAAGIAAIAQVTVDKTYLRGSAQFFAAMEDPKRNAFGWLGSLQTGFVPFGSAINYARQLEDPVQRERMVMFDYVQARLAGFSQGLTPRRDLWGKEVAPDSGYGALFDATAPLKVSRIKDSPIDAEMVRLGFGIERIDKKSNIGGVPINFRDWPREYDFLVRMAGNDLKLPGYDRGTKDLLDEMVQGRGPLGDIYRQLSDGPEGGKATQIKRVVRDARKAAQDALMNAPEFTAFQAHVEEQRRTLQEKRWQLDTPSPFGQQPGVIR